MACREVEYKTVPLSSSSSSSLPHSLPSLVPGEVVGEGREWENCRLAYTELKFERPSSLSPTQADHQRERHFTPLYGQKRRGREGGRHLPASEVTRVLGAGPLPIHLVQERGGITSNRHGGAFNHRAGGRPRCQPLLLFPPLSLLLLKPLLRHLPPVYGCVAVGPGREKGPFRWEH